MRIFAHRGMWNNHEESNTLEAMKRAFDEEIDVEIDIRMQNSSVVVTHDPPLKNEDFLLLQNVFTLFKDHKTRTIALHWKDDDRKTPWPTKRISTLFSPWFKNVFVFDLSLYACRELKEVNASIRTGVSVGDKKYHDRFCDLKEALTSENVDVIWADEYRSLYSKEFFDTCHAYGKIVYCISPDLAGIVGHPRSRDGYQETWSNLIRWGADGICTDRPLELKKFVHICR